MSMDFLLEVVPVPVSTVDRAERYYDEQVGFNVDLDIQLDDGIRLVQLTFDMSPGVLEGLQFVVSDIEAARAELVERGVEISPIQPMDGGVWVDGRGGDWNSFVFLSDSDDNGWVLQEHLVRD